MDKISKEKRSWTMSRVKGKDTSPEKIVRSLLHRLGYRFRLHRKDLPGRPDVVLPKKRIAIFVHGCFWHRHEGCPRATTPRTNQDYWLQKFSRNVARDKKAFSDLTALGWSVIVVWECEMKNIPLLTERFSTLLKSSGRTALDE
ncbi:MAG: very short patch repair endonuclease [Thermodesulfobacteriota bacterium]